MLKTLSTPSPGSFLFNAHAHAPEPGCDWMQRHIVYNLEYAYNLPVVAYNLPGVSPPWCVFAFAFAFAVAFPFSSAFPPCAMRVFIYPAALFLLAEATDDAQ